MRSMCTTPKAFATTLRPGQTHLAAGAVHLAVAADQHADSGAIDVVELSQIDHQLAGAILNQALHSSLDGHQFVT